VAADKMKKDSIEEILNEVQRAFQKNIVNDIDENMKTYKETLDILIHNGFTEYQACIIVSQLMRGSS